MFLSNIGVTTGIRTTTRVWKPRDFPLPPAVQLMGAWPITNIFPPALIVDVESRFPLPPAVQLMGAWPITNIFPPALNH